MAKRHFTELIQHNWSRDKFICVGLDADPDNEKFPKAALRKSLRSTLFHFNSAIIDATSDLVCAYKLNFAFYEGLGAKGITALVSTVEYIQQHYPEIPVIGDIKKGDTQNSNLAYAKFAFEVCGFDAVTLNPFLGRESLEPFLKRKDKGCFILCRTSNSGAKEFQDLPVTIDKGVVPGIESRIIPFHLYVAEQVVEEWNKNNNCGVVIGATCPRELKKIRETVGRLPILIPGIGAQHGEIELAVKYGMDENKTGAIYSSSRAVIFASSGPDFAEAARQETINLHRTCNAFRN